MVKTYAIEWNDNHSTIIALNTRSRRSRRIRRAIRAARAGDIDGASMHLCGKSDRCIVDDEIDSQEVLRREEWVWR